MDIEKMRKELERLAEFKYLLENCKWDEGEGVYVNITGDIDLDYQADACNGGLTAWQAAKAQAVPEGFVLVEKAKLMQIVGSAAIIEPITRGNPLMSKYKTELDSILSTVRAMIEAQEQKG